MNELLQKYIKGEIDYDTYIKLKGSPQKPINNSGFSDFAKMVQKETYEGRPDTGNLSKSIYMDDEELDTYASRGITPVYGSDYEDTRAEYQTWGEQLGNGLLKFAGKTGTAVAGGLGMIPSFFYGAATGSLSNVYDNAFQRALDDANKAMDEALPNYVTNEERENNVLQSMGTMNFWANDFLGGASFVTGAILTELATAGLASPIVQLKAINYLKGLSYGSKLDDVAGLASKFNKYNTGLNVGKFGRQMLTGAGYEAGVEARGFIDEAKEQWINEFVETRGREPMEEELALAMNDIRSVANGVFGTNLALVSASNIITLPKYFGPGISKKLGVNAGEEVNKKWVKSTDELTEAELKIAAKNTGKTVEQLKADKWVNKFDTFNKFEKAAYYAKEALEKPITEGLIEEGMQSFINKTALDYIDSKYEGYNIDAPTDLVESMSKAFSETYGGNDSEFWKEVVIGGLLGGIGGIKLKGGLGYDIKNPKSPEVQRLIAEASQRGMTKETIQSAIRQANITAKQDAAVETGDMFDAKNKEDQSQFDYVATKVKLGRFDEIESEIVKQVEQMTPEEFGEEAGYTNMTKQELAARKQKVVSEFMENAKNIRESFEQASRVTNGMDPDVAEGLGFVLYIGKRIDSREDAASELLSEKLGKVYNNRVMKTMAKFIEFQNEKSSKKIEKYNTKIQELEKLTKEELEANKNRTSSEIMARGKKIESLEKEISQLEKELEMDYHSFLKEKGYERKGKSLEYDRDTVSFKEKLNDFIIKQKELEEKNGKDIFKRPDVDSLIKDVNKLAAFREQQITTANYFFTEKGLNTLQSQIAGLKKLYEEDRVNSELADAQAIFLSKKQEYDRMTDVAALAYKLSASRVGIPVSENAVEPKIEALNKLADTLEDSPEKDYLKKAIETVKQKLNNKDVSNIEKDLDAVCTDLFNKLDNEKYKDLLTLIRQTFDNIIFYLKGAKAESVLETYERLFKIYVPDNMDSEKWLAKNNIDTDDVTLEFRELSPEDPIVKDTLAKNRIAFALEAKTEKPILQDFIGIQRLIQVDGKYYSVVVKVGDKEFGFMLDPNRYKFRQPDGSYRDFNPQSLGDLRLLNPAFVLDNGTITDEGERFINMYKRGMDKFKLVTDAISKGAKKMYSGELKEHFYINKKNQFKKVETKDNFNIVEEVTSKPEAYNIVPKDSPEGIEVSRDKFLKTSFLVYNLSSNLTYYYYNPETNTFEELVNSRGRAQLQKYLKIKDTNERNLRAGLSLIIPSTSTAGPVYTTVRVPQMEQSVSDSIIREMVTNIAERKQPPKLNYLIYADNIQDVSLNIDFTLTKDGRLCVILKDATNKTEKWINITDNAEETDKFSPGTIQNFLEILTKKILAYDSQIGKKYPEFKITGVNKLTYKDVKDEISNIANNATVTFVITQGLVMSPKVSEEDPDFEFISRKKSKPKEPSFEEYDEKKSSAKESPDLRDYVDTNTELDLDELPSQEELEEEGFEEYGGSATNEDFGVSESTDIDTKNTISNGDKIISVQTKPLTNEIVDTEKDLFISSDNNPEGRIYINTEPLKDILIIPNNILTIIDKKTGKELVNKELNPEGAVIFEAMQGRLFVVANVNGQLIPFYKSSAGTSGKKQGEWYPFFGYTGAWIVKGSIDKTTGKMLYSPEIDKVTTLLNENLVFPDKYIDRVTNTIKTRDGNTVIYFNEFFKVNRLWQKEFDSQTGKGTNYQIKGLKENTRMESGLVALITGLNTTELDPSKTPKENSEWVSLIIKNAESTTSKPKTELSKEEKLNEPPDDLDNLAFKIESEEVEYQETIESRINNLKQILPSWVPVDDLKTISSKLNNNGFTYGAFINGIIYLTNNSPKGVEYHEAFHAIFRTMLNSVQIAKAYSEARSKYGKPTNTQLNNLKSLSPLYDNLNNDELEKLWLEEQMADDFQKFMLKPVEPKSFLQRLFDRILKFLNWAKGNTDYLNELFYEIQSGKFVNANKIPNKPYLFQKPAFKAITFEEQYEGGKRKRVLSGSLTNTLLNNIKGVALRMSMRKVVTSYDIKQIIETFKNEFFTEEYQRVRYGSKFDNPGVKNTIMRNIKQLQNALSNQDNIDYIANYVKSEINALNFVNYMLNEEEDGSSDVPTEFMAKETAEQGGFEGLTKEFKKYISLIPVTTDEFGLGIDIKDTSGYISFADPYQLYNHVVRILSNRKPSDMLSAFYSQSSVGKNNKLRYLRNKLFNDIAIELNKKDLTLKEIAELPITELSRSETFNMFVANFRKNNLNFISITPDVEQNKVKVFRSNINDVKDVQYNEWANNSLSKPLPVKDREEILSNLANDFRPKALAENIKTIAELNQMVNDVSEDLKKMGISLSDQYIKLSIYKNHPNIQDLIILDSNNSESYEELNKLLKIYSDLEYLNSQLFTNLNLSKSESLFTVGEENSIGELKKIAEANSYFDFDIIPTVFKNIEGKSIYSYIQPNYITDMVNIFRENSNNIYEMLVTDYDSGLKLFKEFLMMNNLSSNDFVEEEYYRALRFNPILSSTSATDFLNHLETFMLDGLRIVEMDGEFNELTYKRVDDGSTFQSLSPRAKLLTYFYLYADPGKKGNSINAMAKKVNNEEKYSPFITFQNEGKNTQYAFLMPKRQNLIGNKLNNEAKELLHKVFEGEFDTLKKYFSKIANQSPIDKVKGVTEFKNKELYNRFSQALKDKNVQEILDIYKVHYSPANNEIPGLPRMIKFSNIEVLYKNGLLDEFITKAVNQEELTINDTENLSEELMNDVLKETLDLLVEYNIINKTTDNDYTNILLPQYMLDDKTDIYVDLNKVKNFLVDDYINSVSMLNMLVGNLNFQFKDAIDLPKRMAGLNAAGPSLGTGQSNVVIIEDVKGVYTNIDKGVFSKERTDGQSYATQTWYENKYLKTFKKWNPRIKNIYKKIRKAQKLSWDDKEFLDNFGALSNSRKISIFGYSLYGKTSVNPITRNEVSFVEKKNRKIVNELVDKLYETDDPLEYKSILKELHTYYKPYPHTKKMHYLLNSLESSEADLALSESAVKTIIYNTQKIQHDSFTKNEDFTKLTSFKISDTFVREQVITDNMKTKIVDGTQLLQLIDSEQEADTDVTINISGKDINMKVGDVVKVFKNTKAYRITQKYNELKQSYFEEGKPRYKAILKSFRESLEQMGSDPIIREMLSEAENLDNPKYNLNLTRTIFQVEKMLYAYLGEVFSQKVAGQKFTLLTDDAYKVIEDSSGKIITMEEFKNNPIENYTERDLEIFYDKESKTYVAEVVISPQTAYRYGLKPGSEVEIKDKKLLEYIGTRIPTQDKSSMVVMRIVDYLSVEKGNTVILPFETMFFSGADFDIDSLFAQTFATYEEGKKEIVYGDYLSENNKDIRLEKAYKEFRDYYSNVKSVKADYDRFLSLDKKYNTKLEEREYTEKLRQLALIEDFDDMKTFIREYYAETGKDASAAEDDIKEFYKSVQDQGDKALFITLSYVRNNYTKEFSQAQLETAIQIEKSIKEIKELNLNRALLRNKYPSTLEEFKQKYSKQVEDNYTAIQKGTLSSYKPLTKYETDNFMFELKKVLIRNEGNKNSSLRDVERGAAEDLTNKLKQLGINDPTQVNHYLTLASKAKMSIANATGGQNIGVAALGNVMAQYLINAKTSVVNFGTIQEFDFNGDKFINEVLSLWITLGVDNAKHQDAGRFTINKSVQGALVFDTLLNQGNKSYSVEHILSLGLVPSVKDMVSQLENLNNLFKTKDEKRQSLTKGEILKQYKGATPSKKWEQYTIDEIFENVKKLQENPDDKSLDDFQKAATYKLSNLMSIADYALPFTQLLSIIKGNKPTSAQNLQIIDALDSIGLQMTPDGLQHTPKYYYDISDDPSKHPIDFLEVIKSNIFLETEIELFHKVIMEDAGMFLIPMSKDGLELISDIRENLKDSAGTESKLSNLIRTVVNSMGFYAQRNIYKKTGKQELPPETYLTDTEDDTFFLKDFKTLKSFEGLQDNFFLKNLAEKKVQGKDGSPISNKWVQGIQTNFRLNMTPDMKKRMSDDAFSLFAGEVYNKDGTLNTELSKIAKRFTITLVNQLWQVDAGLFLNQSILPYLEPFFLTSNSAALDEVQQAIAGNKTYEEVFGIPKKQLFKEIKTNFLRDYNNLIDIKGNNLIYVKKNIKQAIKKSEYFQGFLKKYEHTQDSELRPLIDKLKKLTEESKDNKVSFSEIDELSPVKIKDDGTMELLLVPSMFDVQSKEARELLKTIYRQALATTGLTNVSYKKLNNNKYILFHQFLNTLIINVPKKKEGDDLDNAGQDIGSEKIIYELVEETIYEGYPLKAIYKKVPAFGSKLHKHYYRTPQENEKIYSKQAITSSNVNNFTIKNISNRKTYSGKVTSLQPNQIFVFGSNPEGRHGLGAAKYAKDNFGAIYGQGEGLQGQSYALPTKDLRVKTNNSLRSISEEDITKNIKKLYEVAKQNPTKEFLVSDYSESNLSGYTGQEMADMFNAAGPIPSNIVFNENFDKLVYKTTINKTDLSSKESTLKNDKFTKGFVETMTSLSPKMAENSKSFLAKYKTMYDLLVRLNELKWIDTLVGKAEQNLDFAEEGSDTSNTETFIKFAKAFQENEGIELMKKCKL